MSNDTSVTKELSFLTRQTGQDELTLLSRALHIGLEVLYRQAVEQALIDEEITKEEAASALGSERVDDIEYAKRALVQDVVRGLEGWPRLSVTPVR